MAKLMECVKNGDGVVPSNESIGRQHLLMGINYVRQYLVQHHSGHYDDVLPKIESYLVRICLIYEHVDPRFMVAFDNDSCNWIPQSQLWLDIERTKTDFYKKYNIIDLPDQTVETIIETWDRTQINRLIIIIVSQLGEKCHDAHYINTWVLRQQKLDILAETLEAISIRSLLKKLAKSSVQKQLVQYLFVSLPMILLGDNNQRYPASGVAPITPRNYRDTYRQIKKYIVDNISNMSREEFESVLVIGGIVKVCEAQQRISSISFLRYVCSFIQMVFISSTLDVMKINNNCKGVLDDLGLIGPGSDFILLEYFQCKKCARERSDIGDVDNYLVYTIPL